jgi:hypothetical protein
MQVYPVFEVQLKYLSAVGVLFIHIWAPAHLSLIVRDINSNTCRDNWTIRTGPVAWPSHSHDLSTLDLTARTLKPIAY